MTTVAITKVECVRLRYGGDNVYLYTTLPQGVWPFTDLAILKLDLARGTAEEYIQEHFSDIPFKLIEG